MPETDAWRILLVDDDAVSCEEVKEFLEGESISGSDGPLKVKAITDFEKALAVLESCYFDILILDVRFGSYLDVPEEEMGIKTLESVKLSRFLPVIFYTGLPNLVRHLETPFIRVVERSSGLPLLLQTLKEIFDTRLPAVNRALIHHLESVQREYMWDFVENQWEQFSNTADRADLAYLLARRLAISLSDSGARQLVERIGDDPEAIAKDKVHPMRYYVMPPVEKYPMTGDIYTGSIGDKYGHWVILTPSCDFIKRGSKKEKAEHVLVAYCVPLIDTLEYKKWAEKLPEESGTVNGALTALLRNSRDRYHFLPGVFSHPDLIVDFQQLITLERAKLGEMERLASLDSPFAEEILTRFSRYFGRVGTPDLDVNRLINKLKAVASSDDE